MIIQQSLNFGGNTMEEIRNKIIELLNLNNSDENLNELMDKQDTLMEELRELATQNNTLVGRILRFQVADSYAIYVITEVNGSTVETEWVDYCDGWTDQMVEAYNGVIPTEMANRMVNWENYLTNLNK